MTVSITTYANTGEYQVTTSGESVAALIATHHLNGQSSVTWNLTVPGAMVREV